MYVSTLFQHFLEHLPVAAAMVDIQMRYLAVSKQWLKIFALEKDNIIGSECDLVRLAQEREIANAPEGEWLSQPWHNEMGEIAGIIFSFIPREFTFEQRKFGICQCDLEGKYIIANRKYCEIIGYSEEELKGRYFGEIIDSKEAEAEKKSLLSLVKGEIKIYSKEKQYINNHKNKWVKLTFYKVSELSGEPKYLLGLIEEITHRKQADTKGFISLFKNNVLEKNEIKSAEIDLLKRKESLEKEVQEKITQIRETIKQLEEETACRKQVEVQLRRSQRRYQTLIQVLPVGFFHTDTLGNCLYANACWLEMTELTQEENLGDGWIKAIHPEDREIVVNEWQQALRENRSLKNEFRILSPNGKITWVLAQTAVERDEVGEVIGYVAAVMDISVRKQIEETLLLISKAVESSSDAIGIADGNDNPIYINKSLCQLFECENLEAFKAAGGIPAIFADENVLKDIFETIKRGDSWSGEVEQKTRSGRKIQTFLRADAVKDRCGKIIGLIGIMTDITERKALEKELAKQQSLLNSLIANAPMGIAILDNQLRYLQINETLAQINVLSPSEHIGKTVREVLPEIAPNLEANCQDILRTGEPLINIEISGENSRLPGIERTLLTSYIPLKSPEGNTIALGIIAQDITERKQAEIKLQQQAQLLDQVYDVVVTTDVNGTITKWNKGAERIYGYAESEIIGKNVTFIHTPEERDRIVHEIIPTILQQGSYKAELKAARKSGESFDMLFSITLQKNNQGEVIGTIGYGIDITERKRLERERLATAQKLSILVQQTPLALIEWSTDLKIINWNPAAERIFGYSSAEALGCNFFELIWNKSAQVNINQLVEDLKQARGGFYLVNENLTKDGRKIVCEWYNNTLVDECGRLIGFASLAQDISARVQAEEALRKSEEKYRNLAQQEELLNRLTSLIRQSLNLDNILETTVQEIRNLLQLNRCQFAWYRPSSNLPILEIVKEARDILLPSLIGSYPASLTIPLFQKLYNREMLRVDDVALLEDKEAREIMQQLGYTAILSLPIQTPSGDIGIVVCICTQESRRWHENEVELLKAVCDQVAIAIYQAELYEQARTAAELAQAQSLELERALHELQQTQSQLIQSEKLSSLGHLVAGVAHEINNPVSFIYGNIPYAQEYTEKLLKIVQLYSQYCNNLPAHIQDEIDNLEIDFIIEDMPKVLSSMKIGAERIQEIVRSLRIFSRLDEAQVKEVDIHEGIDSTLMILNSRLKAQHNRAAIEIIKEYGQLPLVECYPGQMNQVFMNILSNAIDALEDKNSKSSKPWIRIKTCVENNEKIVIYIADNGCGMSETVRQKLFDPFFTTKPVGKGTGLGLAIAYQIVVEKHKGNLRCISVLGEGSEFIIEIPIQQNKPSTPPLK